MIRLSKSTGGLIKRAIKKVKSIKLPFGKKKNKSFKMNFQFCAEKGTGEAVEEATRVRHYTNRKGLKGIEQDGVIRAHDNNRVYVEPANKKPLSQVKAETKYQIKKGRGRDYLEFDVPNSQLD